MLQLFPLLHCFLLHVFTYGQSIGCIVEINVEINPGSRHNSGESFSICHWNLNSVSADNYTKLSSLKVFIAADKFDIICLSETYLDSSVAPDDDSLEISGYSLVRSNHPSNNKRGAV